MTVTADAAVMTECSYEPADYEQQQTDLQL
jgi:hypothetical protein